MEMVSWIFQNPRGLFWIVGPDYDQCHAEFDYTTEALEALGLLDRASISIPKVGSWTLKTTLGGEINTRTSADETKLASVAPDGILMVETGQQTEQAYMRLRGRLAEKRAPLVLSGCLHGDTIVSTDRGLLTLAEMTECGQLVHLNTSVLGLEGMAQGGVDTWKNGYVPTVRAEFTKGLGIEGTPDHRVIMRRDDGSVTWKTLEALEVGDLVAIRYGQDQWGTRIIAEPYLVGLYLAEGCCTKEDRITITTAETETARLLLDKGWYRHGYHYRMTDHELARYWREIGLDTRWKALTKEVPRGIREARREDVIEFLRGLFDGDGSATGGRAKLDTSSKRMANQVQMLLLNLGLPSGLTRRTCKTRGKEFPAYTVTLHDALAFAEIVGFGLARKQNEVLANGRRPAFLRNQCNAGDEFLGYPVMWCRVLGKEASFAETFDLHVPDGHAYWANGLIVHNTFEHGLSWYSSRWMNWQTDNVEEGRSFSLPTWSNLAVFPGGENDPEILALKGTFPEDEFNERYGAIPAKPSTIVFKEFDPVLHVTNDAEYVPGERVQLWIDPGYAHAYAVLAVQIRGENVYQIDEVYETGLTAKEMIAEAKSRRWWKDVQSPCVMDVAGRAHPGTESQQEIWLKTTGLWMITQRVGIVDGILRHRTFLKDPTTGQPRLFHHPRCKGTIAEYSKYRRRKEGADANATELPLDKENDACKALAYGLVANFGYVERAFAMPQVDISFRRD